MNPRHFDAFFDAGAHLMMALSNASLYGELRKRVDAADMDASSKLAEWRMSHRALLSEACDAEEAAQVATRPGPHPLTQGHNDAAPIVSCARVSGGTPPARVLSGIERQLGQLFNHMTQYAPGHVAAAAGNHRVPGLGGWYSSVIPGGAGVPQPKFETSEHYFVREVNLKIKIAPRAMDSTQTLYRWVRAGKLVALSSTSG